MQQHPIDTTKLKTLPEWYDVYLGRRSAEGYSMTDNRDFTRYLLGAGVDIAQVVPQHEFLLQWYAYQSSFQREGHPGVFHKSVYIKNGKMHSGHSMHPALAAILFTLVVIFICLPLWAAVIWPAMTLFFGGK